MDIQESKVTQDIVVSPVTQELMDLAPLDKVDIQELVVTQDRRA